MKYLFTIILLGISTISFSQLNWTYEKVQKKYGIENITQNKAEEKLFQVKALNETESIKFTYNLENIVDIIEIESSKPISNDRFHKLARELNPKFKLTSTAEAKTSNFYYDSKNQLLNVKVYKTIKKSELHKIFFIADPGVIAALIPDIANWK
ncbi:hypothetical protein [Gelidibacter maritimus]|uniref:Uncharacterized protein n=1 Tax=Gelidibacter maritimus TaxID=2761487 RepID=A0A7W2R1Z2_9FLAO|nr:hypothetical protein [Gelidibacter maritimus]MBA6151212.1 hypothetical protein [Gelidibacter maritimus]